MLVLKHALVESMRKMTRWRQIEVLLVPSVEQVMASLSNADEYFVGSC